MSNDIKCVTESIKAINENTCGVLHILYTNCDSILNKMEELRCITKKEQPDCIVLNEILPKNSKFTEMK